jgi:hypothetical protein
MADAEEAEDEESLTAAPAPVASVPLEAAQPSGASAPATTSADASSAVLAVLRLSDAVAAVPQDEGGLAEPAQPAVNITVTAADCAALAKLLELTRFWEQTASDIARKVLRFALLSSGPASGDDGGKSSTSSASMPLITRRALEQLLFGPVEGAQGQCLIPEAASTAMTPSERAVVTTFFCEDVFGAFAAMRHADRNRADGVPAPELALALAMLAGRDSKSAKLSLGWNIMSAASVARLVSLVQADAQAEELEVATSARLDRLDLWRLLRVVLTLFAAVTATSQSQPRGSTATGTARDVAPSALRRAIEACALETAEAVVLGAPPLPAPQPHKTAKARHGGAESDDADEDEEDDNEDAGVTFEAFGAWYNEQGFEKLPWVEFLNMQVGVKQHLVVSQCLNIFLLI